MSNFYLRALLLCVASFAAAAETYYVDCQSGSDDSRGTSADAAWRSVQHLSALTLQPGDAVLFRRGTRCSGPLAPRGSGTKALPIQIGAYGSGPLPIIQADANSEAA